MNDDNNNNDKKFKRVRSDDDQENASERIVRFRTFDGVPSNKPKINEVRIDALNEDNIRSVQERDAFMFYSIPGVNQANILLRDINFNDAEALRRGFVARRVNNNNNAAAGPHQDQQDDVRASATIRRRSRVSTEGHCLTIIAEEIFGRVFGNGDDGNVEGGNNRDGA